MSLISLLGAVLRVKGISAYKPKKQNLWKKLYDQDNLTLTSHRLIHSLDIIYTVNSYGRNRPPGDLQPKLAPF